jgi:hypothetical protein
METIKLGEITYNSNQATDASFSCICNGYSANDLKLWSPNIAWNEEQYFLVSNIILYFS